MSKFFFGVLDGGVCVTMSSALSNAIITRYHSSYKNNILAVPFLCEANTFIHIVFLIHLTKYVYL